MKKAWIAILLSAFLACSAAAFAACSNGGSGSTTISFATYESWEEGFSYLSIMDGFGRVSRSDEQAHGGTYSAKVQPLGSHTDPDTKPYFYYPMKIEGDGGYDYSDFTYLNEIRFWMYNAQDQKVGFEFCIIASIADIEGTDCKGVLNVELSPKTWTEVVYKPDYTALQNMCDVANIAGIGFRFDNCKSADISAAPVLYLDDITLNRSGKANIVIEESVPACGEIQSFDAASSLVYVSMDSGIDFAETWLPFGSEKLPDGVKGGVEFSITDSDIGTWPRLKFDSRTPQGELEKADYFSLLLYFDVPDENIDTVEIRMVPDTGDAYTEYVRTNEWVELKIDTDIIMNNWSTVIGIQSRGLFWVQNGLQGYCFNDIKAIRVADIKGVFNEVRVPDFGTAMAGQEITLPAATLEVNGQTVTAQSWECSVEYSDKALYEEKFGAIALKGSVFTPQAGGIYYVTYSAEYNGTTYTAQAELYVERRTAASGEIESFDDPSSLQNVRLESGRVYTAEYLWADDERLSGADGVLGGVSYTIPSTGGTGSWPMFSVTPRVSASAIESKSEVSFWIYLKADESKLTEENKTAGIRVAVFPTPGSTGDVRIDKYVMPNEWTKITVTASAFVSCYNNVGVGKTGFFWVQNGAPADLITEIRIAGILATGEKIDRPAAAENEIENFADAGSVDGLSIANDAENIGWTDKDVPGGGSAAYADIKAPDKSSEYEPYPAVAVTARQNIAAYRALQEQGYNAVTMQVYLVPENAQNAGKLARMNYWAQQSGMNDSQGTVAVGKWVTLTFSLDAYLAALEQTDNGSVKMFWVQSSYDLPIERIYVRNVQLNKTHDVADLASEGFVLFESGDLDVTYGYETSGVPQGYDSALKATFVNKKANYPNFKFSADKNLLTGSEALKVTLYIEATGTESVKAVMWPYGGKAVSGVSLETNKWITLEFEKDALMEVYGWSGTNGIANTNLFWFTNEQNVSAVYVAKIEAGSLSAKNIAFAEAGFSLNQTSFTTYEDGNDLKAWVEIYNSKGYAYTFTIEHNGKTLEEGKDYTVEGGNNGRAAVLINPESGDYAIRFRGYGDRFAEGTIAFSVAAKEYAVKIDAPAVGTAGAEYTLPMAELTGADHPEKAVWTYEVLFEGETSGLQVVNGKFTPEKKGTYTVIYRAEYCGRQYENRVDIEAGTYAVVVPALEDGTNGQEYMLPAGVLQTAAGSAVTDDGIVWTYAAVYEEKELYEGLYGEIFVQDGKFTPMMAGSYTVTYTAEYNGERFTQVQTLTVVRAAAAENEIESFNDIASLDIVSLESGSDYNKEYLPLNDERLPEGAKGGVSFTGIYAEGGDASWPKLHFSSLRMDAAVVKTYSEVVVPMYIAVKDSIATPEIQIDINGSRLVVKTNTWVNVTFTSAYFADNFVSGICFVQNGGDGVVNRVTEVRIASVYAENNDPVLIDMNRADARLFWADVGNELIYNDDQSNAKYYDRSLAPSGMPEGYERAVQLKANTVTADKWPAVFIYTITQEIVQGYIEQGYRAVTFWMYVENAEGSQRSDLQIRLLPDVYSEQNVATGEWVKLEVSLTLLKDLVNDSKTELKLFWATLPVSDPISSIWLTGFTLEQQFDRINVIDFSSDATAYFDVATEGDTPNVSASWVEQNNLPGKANLPQNGAVKLSTQEGRQAGVRIKSDIGREMYRRGYTAKMLVYIETENDTEVNYSSIHNGSVSGGTIETNRWVEIEIPAYQDGEQNDLYDVYEWFSGGYTGWFVIPKTNDGEVTTPQGVTAIYVAGAWLE